MLKRKLEEPLGDGEAATTSTTTTSAASGSTASTSNEHSGSDNSNCRAGSTDALAPEAAIAGPSPPKKMKKRVNFKGVTVYYFPRRQGFTCVPSEGGSTLGMTEKHSHTKDFSLSEYTKEQKRIHRAILAEQRRQGKMFPSPLLSTGPSIHGPHAHLGHEEDEDDDISSGSESDSEYDDYYFLQPLPIRQRRVLLRTSGVKKIDNEEKDECRDIRISRNVCGCDCQIFCDPATCNCSLAGIQCQVDRLSFPCGCTKDGCGNPSGRIEFNPIRVRTHFIHTLMRLELERKDSDPMNGRYLPGSDIGASFSQSDMNGHVDVVGTSGDDYEDEKGFDNVIGEMETACGSSKSNHLEPGSSNGPVSEVSEASSEESSLKGPVDTPTKAKLKGRLKPKTIDPIDLNLFNSNERGSCRDCQNTEMCNVMMHDVKFSMVSHQQRQQQQRVITAAIGPPVFASTAQQLQQHHHHLNIPGGISLLHPPPQPPPSQQHHMLLFNDGEEEVYQAENTPSMYFDNDDSSYSELGEHSNIIASGAAEPRDMRSYATMSCSMPNAKFGISASPVFTPGLVNSTSAPLLVSNHSDSQSQSSRSPLLNLSCIQNLPGSGVCPVGTTTTESASSGVFSSRSLLPAPPHLTTGAPLTRSLLQPPYHPQVTAAIAPLNGSTQCQTPLISQSTDLRDPAMISQNGQLHHNMTNNLPSLRLEENLSFSDGMNGYHHKFHGQEAMDTSSHLPGSSSKLTYLESHCFSSGTGLVEAGANYLQSTLPATTSFESLGATPVCVSNNNCSSSTTTYDPLHSSSLSTCWSTTLANPTGQQSFRIDASAASSSRSAPNVACSISKPAALNQTSSQNNQMSTSSSSSGPCALSPLPPQYATMTTTTPDRLATHCPGISSHMNSRKEDEQNLTDTASDLSKFEVTHENSVSSSFVSGSDTVNNNSYSQSPSLCSEDATPQVEGCTQSNTESATNETDAENLQSEDIFSEISQPVYSAEISSSSPIFSSASLSFSSSTPSVSEFPNDPEMISSSKSTEETAEADSTESSAPQSSVKSNVQTVESATSGDVVSGQTAHRQAPETNSIASAKDAVGSANISVITKKRDECETETLDQVCEKSNVSALDEVQDEFPWEASEQCLTMPTSGDQEQDFDHKRDGDRASYPSSTTQSSSSSSSPTGDEEKDNPESVSQNFGEIIKDSIVEMVLV